MKARTLSALAHDVADLLVTRGIVVPVAALKDHDRAELAELEGWAIHLGPDAQAPAWLKLLIEAGTATRLRGICRECGCTEDAACPGGCGWADMGQTLCTACVGGP